MRGAFVRAQLAGMENLMIQMFIARPSFMPSPDGTDFNLEMLDLLTDAGVDV